MQPVHRSQFTLGAVQENFDILFADAQLTADLGGPVAIRG
jgi:hypothetical protein